MAIERCLSSTKSQFAYSGTSLHVKTSVFANNLLQLPSQATACNLMGMRHDMFLYIQTPDNGFKATGYTMKG